MTRAVTLALGIGLVLFLLPSVIAAFVDPDPTGQLAHPDHVPAVAVGFEAIDNVPTVPPGVRSANYRATSAEVYPTDELLDDLASCETGGTMDPNAYSDPPGPAGPYRSFFQWTDWAWRHVGGVGDPRDAPYHEQRDRARALILELGWAGQFPSCSLSIGAR